MSERPDGVTELGYLRLGVTDLAAWETFAAEVLGLEVVDEGEPGRRALRMDYWHHRFLLEEDGTDDLHALGLRVAGGDELAAIEKRLADAGVAYSVGTNEEAEALRVLAFLRCEDPAGTPIELFHGPLVEYDKPFHPGRRMHGRFVTGEGGLGHVLVGASDAEASARFYRSLGLRGDLEYKVPIPGGGRFEATFLHANARDHTIALGPPGEKRLNHVMLELERFDDVGLTHEIVRARDIPIVMAPGKHANDHMYSFYCVSPSGWLVEVGQGGRPATHQTEYHGRDVFGHEGA